MKFFLILLCILGYHRTSFAQDRQFVLSVGVPADSDILNRQQLKYLGNKTKQLAAGNGIAALPGQQFLLIAEYTKLREEKAELMRTVYRLEAEVSFTLVDTKSGKIFGTERLPVQGGGTSNAAAVTSALRKISPNKPRLKTFLSQCQNKIREYYEHNCSTLLKEAEFLANKRDYQRALVLLDAVPRNTACRSSADDISYEILDFYGSYACAAIIQRAEIAKAKRDYITTLNLLDLIPPQSDCETQVKMMTQSLEAIVEAEHQEQQMRSDMRYNDALAMEEFRLSVFRDIMASQSPQVLSLTFLDRELTIIE